MKSPCRKIIASGESLQEHEQLSPSGGSNRQISDVTDTVYTTSQSRFLGALESTANRPCLQLHKQGVYSLLFSLLLVHLKNVDTLAGIIFCATITFYPIGIGHARSFLWL